MIQDNNEWELFTSQIEMIRDLPLDINTLQEDIKMPKQIIHSFIQIDKYYHEEFQRNTNVNLRSKWHDKDKYLLIWTLSKLIEHLGINFLEMVKFLVCRISIRRQKAASIWLPEYFPQTQVSFEPNGMDYQNGHYVSKRGHKLKMSYLFSQESIQAYYCFRKYPNDMSWIEITSEFNMKMKMVRYPKQLRERWHNVIDPNITKVIWTLEEDLILFKEAQKNKKWSQIMKLMPNQRTDNQVKNRYNSVIKRLCKELDLDFNNQNDHKQVICMINQSQSTNKEDFYKTKKLKVEDPNSSSQIIQQNLYPIFIYPYYYYYRF
ncbi:hypothetical protein pb186bvf_014803 [Paramecium bursaria]